MVEHGGQEPVGFGRTKSDPVRLAAIERDRDRDRRLLWNRIAGDIARLRAFLRALEPSAWAARGTHSTRGEMDLSGIVDEFLVGHLEQHADQLDGLVTARKLTLVLRPRSRGHLRPILEGMALYGVCSVRRRRS